MKKQTYVTVIERGYGDDFDYSIAYAGDDLKEAKNFLDTDNEGDRAILRIYINGVRVKKLEKLPKRSWTVIEDLAASLILDINALKKTLLDKEAQLNKILEGDENNE